MEVKCQMRNLNNLWGLKIYVRKDEIKKFAVWKVLPLVFKVCIYTVYSLTTDFRTSSYIQSAILLTCINIFYTCYGGSIDFSIFVCMLLSCVNPYVYLAGDWLAAITITLFGISCHVTTRQLSPQSHHGIQQSAVWGRSQRHPNYPPPHAWKGMLR